MNKRSLIGLVKTPICTFCAKTGMLCKNCKEKLRKGEISSLDVEISKLLVKSEKQFAALQKASFTNAIAVNDFIILIGDKNLQTIFTNPQMLEEISKSVEHKLKIIVKQGSERQTLESIFAPLTISGIDKLFIPDGTYELKLRLRGNFDKLELPVDTLRQIAAKAIGADVRIEMEDQE